MYIYIKSAAGYTVGSYLAGKWHPVSEHKAVDEAARRAAWLNGGGGALAECVRIASRFSERIEITVDQAGLFNVCCRYSTNRPAAEAEGDDLPEAAAKLLPILQDLAAKEGV